MPVHLVFPWLMASECLRSEDRNQQPVLGLAQGLQPCSLPELRHGMAAVEGPAWLQSCAPLG